MTDTQLKQLAEKVRSYPAFDEDDARRFILAALKSVQNSQPGESSSAEPIHE